MRALFHFISFHCNSSASLRSWRFARFVSLLRWPIHLFIRSARARPAESYCEQIASHASCRRSRLIEARAGDWIRVRPAPANANANVSAVGSASASASASDPIRSESSRIALSLSGAAARHLRHLLSSLSDAQPASRLSPAERSFSANCERLPSGEAMICAV